MKVSLNWIRDINSRYHTSADPAPDGIDKLVEKIGAQLGAVEEVIDLGKKYKGIVVVKVVSNQKHPNADKLSVCLIDDGKAVKNVKRNKDGFIEVVHGAPNVKAGMLAAWIPPGVAVPSTYEKEAFVLEARDIRGIVSNGMLASAKELALGDEHEGILEIDENVQPGTPFGDVYYLDDYVIDIENKMFTHRPDCFGMLGIARELAGIQNHVFKSPDWYRQDAKIPKGNARDTHRLVVKNQLPKMVPRFCAVVMKDVVVKPSPVWLQARLSSVGVRPINNIVDLTNYYMLETAQPLHAYDYDKLKTGILGVRLSRAGEQLRLLGGKQIKLDEGAVVITDDSQPIGLGGVMGGADTEVDKATRTIILECANFGMVAIRQAAMKYGLFTDAATRFTKNQSPLQCSAVLSKAVDEIAKIAGGRVSGEMVDDIHIKPETIKSGNVHAPVKVECDFINLRLGLDLSTTQMSKLLTNVGFKVNIRGDELTINVPFWRTDIEIAEDVVEEVGRLYGYDKLPLKLPPRDLTPAELNPTLNFKSRLRNILTTAGANEVLTYSFVDASLLQKVGQSAKNSFHVRNAVSPNLQYYRQTLMPSLLEKIHPNIKLGFSEFALFEIGRGHFKGLNDDEKLPRELEQISLVYASHDPGPGAPYYEAKKYCDWLLAKLGVGDKNYVPLKSGTEAMALTYYESSRSADIQIGGKMLGRIGEFKPAVTSALKLPIYCAGFELDISQLVPLASGPSYQPLNRFPSLDQDFCLRSKTDLTYTELTEFMTKQLSRAAKTHGYVFNITALDIFQRQGNKSPKQTTWRIRLWHPNRTLTTKEINQLFDKIAAEAAKKLKAERV